MAAIKPLAAALCAASITPFLYAQESSPPIEEIIVTGSRIPRPDFESASPIVTVDSAAFRRTSASSVEAVLGQLPQFVPDYGSTSNNPSLGGKATVQLRGLGANSTLVLMDGRRLIPADGGGAVDVNIIPPALVERVEIISGGASAVYGSDAVAGVVNFKLRRDFEGVQIDGNWGQTDREDGDEKTAGITAGTQFAEGRGRVYGYVAYSERDAVYYDARDYSAHPLVYQGPGNGTLGPDKGFLPFGSAQFIAEGRVQVLASPEAFQSVFARYGFAPGSLPYQTQFATNEDRTLFLTGNSRSPATSVVANYRGVRDPAFYNERFYTFNFAPWNYLQLPQERTSGFGRLAFDIDEDMEAYAQLLYANYSADQSLAPATAGSIVIPRSNPYIPPDLAELLDSRTTPDDPVSMNKRFMDNGPRHGHNDYDVYQFTAGLRGELFGTWHYEAYAQHGENDQREEQRGNVLRSRIAELTNAADGGQSICGEFDIFRIGHISQDCIAHISAGGVNRSGYEQSIVEISMQGPLGALPAGPIEWALGLMYKRDEYFYDADTIASVFLDDLQPDIQGFNASDDIQGSDHNTDAYLEASFPLLRDKPLVQSLEALLGYRHTQYASAGGADAWKAEILYRAIDALRLRGSLQRAVRAPSVYELYLPRLPVVYVPFFGDPTDPCDAGSDERNGPNAAQVEALCLEQGIPSAALPEFAQAEEYNGVNGGNTELEPEEAGTVTLGVVLSPAFEQPLFAEMQFSLDWYRIEIDDSIEAVDAYTYIPKCYDPATNPGMSASDYWCGFFSRNSSTHYIENVVDTLVNFGRKEVSGVDVQLDWQIPAGPGRIGISALGSWLDRFEIKPEHGLDSDDRTGIVGNGIGGSQPEWKGTVRVAYEWNWLNAGVQWRYIAAMHDADITQAGWNYRVPSQHYWNLFLDATFDSGALEGLGVRTGVENVGDEVPPWLPSQVQANTDPSQYDALGRRYYLNLSYRF